MKKKKLIIITIVVLLLGSFLYVDFNKNNTTKTLAVTAKEKGAPANLAFLDNDFYKLVIDAYNATHDPDKDYDDVLTDEELADIETIIQRNDSSYDIDDVSGLEKLTGLKTFRLLRANSNLMSVDLSNNTLLEDLYLSNINLKVLDLSKNTSLKKLSLKMNVSTFDVSNLTALEELSIETLNNNLETIDLTANTALTYLNLSNNKLTGLDLSKNTALETLNLSENQLTGLDLSKNTALKTLNLSKNQLTSLDLSKNTVLETIELENNQLTSVNLNNISGLKHLNLKSNKLTSFNFNASSQLQSLSLESNKLTSVVMGENDIITKLSLSGNDLTSVSLGGFTALEELSLGSNDFTTLSSLSSITSLRKLDISGNQNITTLDLSGNPDLTSLTSYNGRFGSIDLSGNAALVNLELRDCWLTEINLSANTALKTLNLKNGRLEEINLSKNVALTSLDLTNNNISSIDLSKNTALTTLDLDSNKITEIDLSKNTQLKTLSISSAGTKLSGIDLSNNNSLTSVSLSFQKVYMEENDVVNNTVKMPSDYNSTVTVDDDSIVEFDSENNRFNALSLGETKVRYKAHANDEHSTLISLGIDFEVMIPATSISLDKSSVTLTVDENDFVLNATVLPENSTQNSVIWRSSDVSVVRTIVDANDSSKVKLWALSPGTATITASTLDGKNGKYTATCEVTVEPVKVNLTYYANDGSSNSIVKKVPKGTDTTVGEYTFARPGYTFKYWNTRSDGQGTTYQVGATIKPEDNVNLYAIYTKTVNSLTIKGIKNKYYTGKNITQIIDVYDGSKLLASGNDFKVTYSNNKNIGTATVTITGINNYSGSIKKTFKIIPKAPTMKKVTSTAKKSATIQYSSVAGGVYYQVSYKVKGGSSWKSFNTKGTKVTKKLFASKKYYYYKVRAYKKVGTTIYYGPYSNIKYVKIK